MSRRARAIPPKGPRLPDGTRGDRDRVWVGYHWRELRKQFRAGARYADPDLGERLLAVDRAIGDAKSPPVLDPDGEAMIAAALGGHAHADRSNPELAASWLRSGGEHAVRTLCRAGELVFRTKFDEHYNAIAQVPYRRDSPIVPLGLSRSVRDALAASDDVTRAAARKAAETLRATLDGSARWSLTLAFPGELEWRRADSDDAVARNQATFLELAPDPDRLAELVRLEIATELFHKYHTVDPGEVLGPVTELGDAALPAFEQLFAAVPQDKRVGSLDRALAALAPIDRPAVQEFVARWKL